MKMSEGVFSDLVQIKDKEKSEWYIKEHPLVVRYSERIKELKAEGFPRKIVSDFKETMLRVGYIFETKPSTKGKISMLIAFYWNRFCNAKLRKRADGSWDIHLDNFDDLNYLTSPEMITRAARRWKEHGFYPSSPEVQAKRDLAEKAIRSNISKTEVEQLDLGDYL